MIAHLTGILSMKSPEFVILDVNGVGYGVYVTLNTFYELPDIGTRTTLLTYTHVREDTFKLYGFLTQKEKALFGLLIGINKIGPKLARNILSKHSVDSLAAAILQSDSGLISSIPGIGEKTAQRLILELKDKIPKIQILEPRFSSEIKAKEEGALFSDAVSALINLGYAKQEAKKAVSSSLASHASETVSLKDLIKISLELLSG